MRFFPDDEKAKLQNMSAADTIDTDGRRIWPLRIMCNDFAQRCFWDIFLADENVNTGVNLDAFNGRRVGTDLVNEDLLGNSVQAYGALKIASGRRLVPLGTLSHVAVSRKSTVSPARSTARQMYFH